MGEKEFLLTQEEISKKVGKSRSTITNSMRLLNLDSRVINFVKENKLSGGHARTLLSLSDGELQFELAEKIIEEDLSVRAVERIVKSLQEKQTKQGLCWNVYSSAILQNSFSARIPHLLLLGLCDVLYMLSTGMAILGHMALLE